MLALRRAAASAAQKRAVFSVQTASLSSGDAFKDKERATETAFFNKEDEKALRRLLKKLKGQADVNDAPGLKDHVDHDVQGLKEIMGLNLSQEQVNALLKWKHEH
ncbi:Oxysterol-binding protein 9, partial [Globisporangium splendens]